MFLSKILILAIKHTIIQSTPISLQKQDSLEQYSKPASIKAKNFQLILLLPKIQTPEWCSPSTTDTGAVPGRKNIKSLSTDRRGWFQTSTWYEYFWPNPNKLDMYHNLKTTQCHTELLLILIENSIRLRLPKIIPVRRMHDFHLITVYDTCNGVYFQFDKHVFAVATKLILLW